MILPSFSNLQRNQFWIFQLIGWSALVVILILLSTLFNPPTAGYFVSLALTYAGSALIAAILTLGLRLIYRWTWESGFIVRFLLAWFGSLFTAYLWQLAQIDLASMLLDVATIEGRVLFGEFLIFSYPLMLFWSGFYFIIKYYQLFQIEKEKSLRSEALAHEAQLLMLRYQLNPHFLFNTLNAISTLVLSKTTEQANEMVTKLSKFLRYSLDHSPLDRVNLAHELETSGLYLDIEKVRFADRLRLEFDIETGTESALVPTMILQPIIENSFKHGIAKNEKGGTITIRVRKKGKFLTLEVADDGPGLSADEHEQELSLSKGVGISNIRNRLQVIYGNDHELMFTNVEPSGLSVTVVIPYDTE
ncbi:MAG: sensor histidine kinase [Pseudohongiellaceae bacterium]